MSSRRIRQRYKAEKLCFLKLQWIQKHPHKKTTHLFWLVSCDEHKVMEDTLATFLNGCPPTLSLVTRPTFQSPGSTSLKHDLNFNLFLHLHLESYWCPAFRIQSPKPDNSGQIPMPFFFSMFKLVSKRTRYSLHFLCSPKIGRYLIVLCCVPKICYTFRPINFSNAVVKRNGPFDSFDAWKAETLIKSCVLEYKKAKWTFYIRKVDVLV